MRNIKFRLPFAVIFFVASVCSLYAQDVTLKGQVWDEVLNEPLIGVNVIVEGTGQGVITDFDGNFVLKAKKNQVLIFSFIGYKDVKLVVKPGMNLSRVVMSEDTQQIEEVVVVGYGQQTKASTVAAISTTKGDDLLKVGSVTSVSEALQGQMPGVTSVTSSSKPGAAASIFIRGKASWENTSPLCLVDGVERNINDVDVNEIETISVLKDASATAVYGVKGANGVILLTTKRGTNEKPVVNFSANFGFKQPTTELDWADYPLSMKMYNEAVANDNLWEKYIPQSTISAWEHAYATGNYGPYNDYFPEVNWWDEIVSDFGVQQNYNLNIRGGTERMAYFASVGYLYDGGIYDLQKHEDFDPSSYYRRYNWRTNFDFNLTKSTKISINIAGKMSYQNQPGGAGDVATLAPFLDSPTNQFPIRYSDREWGVDEFGGRNLYIIFQEKGQRQYRAFQGFYDFVLNQNLDKITKGLSLKASVSYNTASGRETSILKAAIRGAQDAGAVLRYPVAYNRVYDYSSPIINADGTIDYPMISQTRFPDDLAQENQPIGAKHDQFKSYSRNLYYEVSLNYKRSFNHHNVSALALFNRRITDSTGGSELEFPAHSEDWVGRVTYNWRERYLSEVNMAYTGSEKFAPGKRFGFFPSFSVGWRLTEEPFMKKIQEKWLTNFKIRYSYGEVGSDRGARRFNYIQKFDSKNNVQFGMNHNVNYGPLYFEGALAYPDATWETAVKQNLGIEMTLFKNLNLNFELFDEKRSGILMTPNIVGPWLGAGVADVNIGKTKNHGLEFELGWRDRLGKYFTYFANFSFSASENRVVFRDDPKNLDDYMKLAGKPIGFQNKYVVSGNLSSIDDIYNYTSVNLGNNGLPNKLVPGDFAYVDYNGDGLIDGKDMVPVEEMNYPLTTYGLSLGFSYKGFGMNALFYAATGVYKDEITDFLWDFPNGHIKAQPNTLDRWTYEDRMSEDIKRPSVHINKGYNTVASTYSYTNHSFLRLKNLEFNYSFPKHWLRKLNISSCQVYVNGNNIFTISNVDDRRDPETGGDNAYPIVKRYNVGMRLSF